MDASLFDSVAQHVGTHGAILQKVGFECTPHLREFATALVHAMRSSTELNVVAYCIGGEKWSVALATVLYHCIKGLVGDSVEPVIPHHICSPTWHRTCRGNCDQCHNGLHTDVVTQAAGVADAVRRLNQIYLEREVA